MHSRIRHLGAALLLLGWVTLSPNIAAAQRAKTPVKPSPPPAEEATDASDADQIFAVQIQVVSVPVTVTDKKGRFVTDLDVRDFTILDKGEPQKVENFELSSEPLSVAVVVETSSRVQPLLPDLRGTGILITQLILGESGEAAVLGFDREVKTLQDFTQDSDKIEAALKGLSTGPGQVRLSDAVGRAVFLLQRRPRDRRKVILIVSEARDQGSSSKLGNVLRGAQQLGISVYTVGLSTMKALVERPADQSGPTSPYPPGVITRPMGGGALPTPDIQSNAGAANVNVLEIVSDLVTYAKGLIGGNPLAVYAAGTGGADFPSDNKGKLENALGRIGEELRNQYMLTYRPSNLNDPGYHTIQVLLSRKDLEARFRPGYAFAPPTHPTPAAPQTPPESNPQDNPPAAGEKTGPAGQ